MTSVGSNFLCGRLLGTDPPLPVRIHLSLTSHIHVDVMNEWPLNWSLGAICFR